MDIKHGTTKLTFKYELSGATQERTIGKPFAILQ